MTSDYAVLLGMRLKHTRQASNLELPNAAERAGLPADSWQLWEGGEDQPDIDQFAKICRLLKPDIEWLMGG